MSMTFRYNVAVILLGIVGQSCGAADESGFLSGVVDSWEQWRFESTPEWGPQFGDNTFTDRRESFDYGAFEQRKVINDGYIVLADMIDAGSLSNHQEELTLDMLKYTLEKYTQGHKYVDWLNLKPLKFLQFPTPPLTVPSWASPTPDEFDIRRMIRDYALYDNQMRQNVQLMRRAVELGRTYPTESIDRVKDIIDDFLNDVNTNGLESVVSDQLAYIDKCTSISDQEKVELKQQLLDALDYFAVRTYREVADFLFDEYKPHCRSTAGVHSWPGDAEAFYDETLVWHTSIEGINAFEVHATGLREVKRIEKLMREIIDRKNASWTIADYEEHLSSTPELQPQSAEDYLKKHENAVYNIINPTLTKVFHEKDLPVVPVNVVPLPYNGPSGYDGPQAPGDNGTFFVNLYNWENTNTASVIDLSLHEANPGHHMQIVSALYLEGLTAFRTNPQYNNHDQSIPLWYPFHNAYVEGWALYSESLGFEDYLDVLKTDEDKWGALSGEMFRACRLVVDTGMHSGDLQWTKQAAMDFFYKYTGGYSEREIDRYMTRPGQACGYKIGQLAIKELRDKAEEQLGSAFNIKDFHSEILRNGALPMSLLEKEIDNWIHSTKPTTTTEKLGSKDNAQLRVVAIAAVILCFVLKDY